MRNKKRHTPPVPKPDGMLGAEKSLVSTGVNPFTLHAVKLLGQVSQLHHQVQGLLWLMELASGEPPDSVVSEDIGHLFTALNKRLHELVGETMYTDGLEVPGLYGATWLKDKENDCVTAGLKPIFFGLPSDAVRDV